MISWRRERSPWVACTTFTFTFTDYAAVPEFTFFKSLCPTVFSFYQDDEETRQKRWGVGGKGGDCKHPEMGRPEPEFIFLWSFCNKMFSLFTMMNFFGNPFRLQVFTISAPWELHRPSNFNVTFTILSDMFWSKSLLFCSSVPLHALHVCAWLYLTCFQTYCW